MKQGKKMAGIATPMMMVVVMVMLTRGALASSSSSSEDKCTGQKSDITIERSGDGLTEDQIKKMVKEAEDFEDEDKKFRELTEARNNLEAMVYTAKEQLSDLEFYKDDAGVSEDQIEKAREVVKDAMGWLDSQAPTASLEELKEKKSELEAVLNHWDETIQDYTNRRCLFG